MMRFSCKTVEEKLAAFYDGELSAHEQIAIAAHLEGCRSCAASAERLQVLGDALRVAAASVGTIRDDLSGLKTDVISRVRAERDQSWAARFDRVVEDMHLVWTALGATMASLACVVAMSAILQGALAERADSLAGILAAMASPVTAANRIRPDDRMLLPRVSPDTVMPAMLVSSGPGQKDALFALTAVVTRDGDVADLQVLLANGQDRQTILDLLDAASMARFEPARVGGLPVAVSMVWLFAHTTVRGRLHS